MPKFNIERTRVILHNFEIEADSYEEAVANGWHYGGEMDVSILDTPHIDVCRQGDGNYVRYPFDQIVKILNKNTAGNGS